MKQNTLVVYIGRFQPFHDGHLNVVKTAYEHGDHVLLLVGSSFIARNIKNPFTYDERTDMIARAVNANLDIRDKSFQTYPIMDNLYNDQQWAAEIQANVEDRIEELFGVSNNVKVKLIGHTKDESSYYLKMFPQWELIEVDNYRDINSTTIRQLYFNEKTINENALDDCPKQVIDWLIQFQTNPAFNTLAKEMAFITAYKKSFEVMPYPPTFVTTDAVVICNAHVLLIKRKAMPGKNLWAIPGGFLNQNETIKDGILRELIEETKIKVHYNILCNSIKAVYVYDAPGRSLRGRTITHAGLIVLHMNDLPQIKGSDDAAKAKWIPISKFLNMSEDMFEDHYSIITDMIGRV